MSKKRGEKVFFSLLIITVLLITSSTYLVFDPGELMQLKKKGIKTLAYTEHDPITINSNSEFEDMAILEGWSGDGSLGDPYVIEDLSISDVPERCIEIGNVDVHFIIRYCLFNHSDSGGGILIHSSSHGAIFSNIFQTHDFAITCENSEDMLIQNNDITDCSTGIILGSCGYSQMIDNEIYAYWYCISIVDSVHLEVTNNICSEATVGIYTETSDYVRIIENTCENNDNYGIEMWQYCIEAEISDNYCSNNGYADIDLTGITNFTITNNELHGQGLNINPDIYERTRVKEVSGNTLDGKPIIYYQDKSDEIISGDYGQVFVGFSENITVENMYFTDNAVCVLMMFTNHSTIQNITCYDARYGIIVNAGEDNLITDCNCSYVQTYGILLESEQYFRSLDSHTIQNCYVAHCSTGISVQKAKNNLVVNNYLERNDESGIELMVSSGNLVLNNTVVAKASMYYSMYIFYSENEHVVNNTFTNSPTDSISIRGAMNCEVTGNNCSSSGANGIRATDTSYCTIQDNIINFNSGNGIESSGSHNMIQNNNCSFNGAIGIQLDDVGGSHVSMNTCNNNSQSGIQIGNAEDRNFVYNNTCFGNADAGIYLSESEFTFASNNTLSYNYNGISLTSETYNNSLYWNLLINNTNANGIDEGQNNRIHNNYWEDYVGIDANSDGIGDTPYPISGSASNEDPYPYMKRNFQPIRTYWTQIPNPNQFVEFGDNFRYDFNTTGPEPLESLLFGDYFELDNDLVLTSNITLPVDNYLVDIYVRNIYGYYLMASLNVSVQDTTAPQWAEPITDQYVEYNEEFVFDLDATDLSGISHYQINDTENFHLSSESWNITSWTLDLGSYGLEVTVFDIYGNTLVDSFTVYCIDSTPPVIQDQEDLNVYLPDEPWVAWTVIEDNPESYVLLIDGVIVSSGNWTGGSSLEFALPDLGPGTYNVTLIVTDKGGNTVWDSLYLTVHEPWSSTQPTTSVGPTTPVVPSYFGILIAAISLTITGAIVVVVIIAVRRRRQ